MRFGSCCGCSWSVVGLCFGCVLLFGLLQLLLLELERLLLLLLLLLPCLSLASAPLLLPRGWAWQLKKKLKSLKPNVFKIATAKVF